MNRILALFLLLFAGMSFAQPYVAPTAVRLTYNSTPGTVATPTFSPLPNTFSSSQSVTISAPVGAVIHYTTNGNNPTSSSPVYSSPVSVTSGTVTILAIATQTGLNPSAIGGGPYTITVPSGTPTEAASVGYNTNTFSVGVGTAYPFNATTIDKSNTQASGYRMYLFQLSNFLVDPSGSSAGSDVTFPGDGSVVLTGNKYGSEIATAIGTNSWKSYTGTAFSGGYYIEMIYKQPAASAFLCSSGSACSTGGWPISLSYTLEGSAIFAAGSCSLPGFPTGASCAVWPQTSSYGASFNHQIEHDWFENHYGRVAPALHESFGIFNTTCNPGNTGGTKKYCQTDTAMPAHTISGLDLTQYHKYGVLWVPATSSSSGYEYYYIDDVKQPGTTTWTQQYQNTGNSPFIPANLPNFCTGSPGNTSCSPNWRFGVTDPYHHIPILGTGVLTSGASSNMQVQAINIWQASAVNNVYNGPTAAATPTFSPVAGSYSGTTSVTITSGTGQFIYYTTDGSTPTVNSPLYTSPIAVPSTATVKAIALAPSYSTSAVGSAAYTITAGGPTVAFTYPSGFASAGSAISIASEASLNGSVLQVTDTSIHRAGSFWYNSVQDIHAGFTTDFTWGLESAVQYNGAAVTASTQPQVIASMTFAIQNANLFTWNNYKSANQARGDANVAGYGSLDGNLSMWAPGSNGGYAQVGINNSIAVQYNMSSNQSINYPYRQSTPPSFTGLYGSATSTNTGTYGGAGPYNSLSPVQDMSGDGINLNTTHTFSAHLVYDGTILTSVVKDNTTGAQSRQSWPVDIPTQITGNTGYVGFTGGSANNTAAGQGIDTWTFSTGYYPRLATPTFTVTPGQYPSTQTVGISGPSGAAIYYTTNGREPTSNSNLYASPLTVSASTNIKAVAIQTSHTDSLVAQGYYQIATSGTPNINFPSGFASAGGLISLVGYTQLNSSNLQLTDATSANQGQVGAMWFTSPVPVSSFSTTWQMTAGTQNSDFGMAFVLQNVPTFAQSPSLFNNVGGPGAIGGTGAGLGYSNIPHVSGGSSLQGGYAGLTSSVAVTFHNGNVGVYTGGAFDDGSKSVSSGFTFTGHTYNCTLTYSGTTLSLSMQQVGGATFTNSWTVNIPSVIGSSTAFAGFTAGAQYTTGDQSIVSWTM